MNLFIYSVQSDVSSNAFDECTSFSDEYVQNAETIMDYFSIYEMKISN